MTSSCTGYWNFFSYFWIEDISPFTLIPNNTIHHLWKQILEGAILTPPLGKICCKKYLGMTRVNPPPRYTVSSLKSSRLWSFSTWSRKNSIFLWNIFLVNDLKTRIQIMLIFSIGPNWRSSSAGGGGGHSNTKVVHMRDHHRYIEVFKTYPSHNFPSPRKTPPKREFRAIPPPKSSTHKQAFLDDKFGELWKMIRKRPLVESKRTLF